MNDPSPPDSRSLPSSDSSPGSDAARACGATQSAYEREHQQSSEYSCESLLKHLSRLIDGMRHSRLFAQFWKLPTRHQETLRMLRDFGAKPKSSYGHLLDLIALSYRAQEQNRSLLCPRSNDVVVAVGIGPEMIDCYVSSAHLKAVFTTCHTPETLQPLLETYDTCGVNYPQISSLPELLAQIAHHLCTQGDAKRRLRATRSVRHAFLRALPLSRGAPGGFRFFLTSLFAAWHKATYPLLGPGEYARHLRVGETWSTTDNAAALLDAITSPDSGARSSTNEQEGAPIHFSINFSSRGVVDIFPENWLSLKIHGTELRHHSSGIGANLLVTGETSSADFDLPPFNELPLPQAVALSGFHKIETIDAFLSSATRIRERLGPGVPISVSMADPSIPSRSQELVERLDSSSIRPQIISFEAGEAYRFIENCQAPALHPAIAAIDPSPHIQKDPWGRNGLEFPHRALSRLLTLSELLPHVGAIRIRSHFSDLTLVNLKDGFWSLVAASAKREELYHKTAAALLGGRCLAVAKVTLANPASPKCLHEQIDPLPPAPSAASLLILADLVRRLVEHFGGSHKAAEAAEDSLLHHGWTPVGENRLLFAVTPPEFPAHPAGNSVGCGDLIDMVFAQFLATLHKELTKPD